MLHVREFGDLSGRPVLALHGLNGHGGCWADFATRLDGVRLICPDLRGHGRSTVAPPWYADQHADDLTWTLDALHVREPVDVIGYSFGGLIASTLARQDPDRVRRLVLLDPGIALPPQFVEPMARRALAFETFGSPTEAVNHLKAIWPMLSPAQAQAEVDESLVPSSFVEGRWQWRSSPLAAITAFSEMCRAAAPPLVATLLVRTSGNPQGTQAYAALCQTAPQVRITTLDCGHRLLLECPAETAALVSTFLA